MSDGWTTHHVLVRGLRIACHGYGDASRPPIVLAHGFQDHGKTWIGVARALADRYFLVAVDHRGHGESGWVGDGGDYIFYDYFNDLHACAELLRLPPFVLVGHSMGGNVATGYAAMRPPRVRALVLLEGMGFVTHDPADSVARLVKWSDAISNPEVDRDVAGRRRARRPMADLETAAARLRQYNPRLSLELSRELAQSFSEPEAAPGTGLVWRFDPLHKVPASKPYLLEEARAIWRGIEAPVLSLYGAETSWVPPDLEGRHACLRAVRAAVMEGAGHNLHHDRPELVAEAIDRFARAPAGPLPEGLRESAVTAHPAI